jgi:hypothetical protein
MKKDRKKLIFVALDSKFHLLVIFFILQFCAILCNNIPGKSVIFVEHKGRNFVLSYIMSFK